MNAIDYEENLWYLKYNYKSETQLGAYYIAFKRAV